MPAEIILGFFLKSAASGVQSKALALLKKRAAARELAKIGEQAVNAAAEVAPALGADLRSTSFLEGVVGPMLHAVVQNPSELLGSEHAKSHFIDMFAQRFAMGGGVDETLERIFDTDRTDLDAAFDTMLLELRRQLFSSTYWRDIGLYQSQEEIRSNVSTILSHLDELRQSPASSVDLEAAKHDAYLGSSELRHWPKDIDGEEIYRPEMDRLLGHIKANEEGTSLLIGDAGSGKSALLADLTGKLEKDGLTVFAIKADVIPASVLTIEDIGRAMGMSGSLMDEIEALAQNGRVALLVDQLDAVSEVMDRSSARMQLLLRLVRQLRDRRLPIHVLVSSRPFEAAHDARFAQLKAEEFRLELPSLERVTELLEALGISVEGVDPVMLETIRRPFALKLFVDLARRGIDVKTIQPGELLDAWLATAKLGSDKERAETLALMERLATEMITTETLWRPADRFTDSATALARAEASGLIARSGDKVGFSHQSWLDDFQAKGFHTGKDLADYAWRNQDSLFMRATLLRSLQRLRIRDEGAYDAAVKALLFDRRTRRHIKHLIVDVIAAQAQPSRSEIAWVDALVGTDPILANRGFGNIASRWDGWRAGLKGLLPNLMADQNFQWRSVQLLAAEATHDPDYVASLIARFWSDEKHDQTAFRVLEQAGVLTPKIEAIFETLLARSPIDPYGISHFVTALSAEKRYDEASRIVARWARSLKVDRPSAPQLYGVSKLAAAAPQEFAEAMLPWLVDQARQKVEPYREGVRRYPDSKSLPWDWDFEHGEDGLILAVRSALKRLAADKPDAAEALLASVRSLEVEPIQEVIAQTLAAGGAGLAGQAFDYLMGDQRRLQLGDASVTLEPGLSGTEPGLTTQELIEAIAPHLTPLQVEALRDRIEAWSVYGPEFGQDAEVDVKRRMHQWIDEHRLALLERLPPELLPPIRRRQIAERRKHKRMHLGRVNAGHMASFVGSPMPVEAMIKGSDNAILKMLDELDDTSSRRPLRRPISRDGGVTELSRAFAAFGKEQTDRALRMVTTRFVAGRHETAAGELIHTLARESDVEPQRLVALIHELSEKGFNSRGWRRDASWALQALASKTEGLEDRTIELLASWIDKDPSHIAEQVEVRLQNKALNAERNPSKRESAEPVLFDRQGGAHALPQNNYTILSAIFQGLMNRKERGFDQWLTVLEDHAGDPEDTEVWSTLFLFEARWLFWADRPRTTALLERLFANHPAIFDDTYTLPMVWFTREMFGAGLIEKIVLRWLGLPDVQVRQGAAEFIQAGLLIDRDNPLYPEIEQHLDGEAPEHLVGRLFVAAAIWREDDPKLRPAAHAVLMAHVRNAADDAAHAISGAVDRTDRLIADALTKELIAAIGENADLLSKSFNGRFGDGLQGLLLYPGFDETVLDLTAKVAELIAARDGGPRWGIMDEDFVQVTVALQRSDGPLRARAMDIYEQLLDAGAYGAEQAATDATKR